MTSNLGRLQNPGIILKAREIGFQGGTKDWVCQENEEGENGWKLELW